jgi:hypothetical protein
MGIPRCANSGYHDAQHSRRSHRNATAESPYTPTTGRKGERHERRSLGLTSGPIFSPDGARVGTFNSVWRRETDGSWKVIFDRGCPECECPSENTNEN